MIRKLDHLVITTARLDACIAFYRALGFKAMDAGGRWELFARDFKINVHIKGHELDPRAAHVQTGSADLCFELDCPMAEGLTQLEHAGIPVELGPVARQGVRGSMASVYLRDPDKNLIELCAYTV